MKDFTYSIPAHMEAEKKLITNICSNLIEQFNKRVAAEKERLKLEKQAALKARKFTYSIQELNDGWKILHKIATNPVAGSDSNELWSKPFRIVNSVLFTAEIPFKGQSYDSANALLIQGIVPDNFLETIPEW